MILVPSAFTFRSGLIEMGGFIILLFQLVILAVLLAALAVIGVSVLGILVAIFGHPGPQQAAALLLEGMQVAQSAGALLIPLSA